MESPRPQKKMVNWLSSFSFDDLEGDWCSTYPGHWTGLTRAERDHFRTPYCDHLWTLAPFLPLPSHILFGAPRRLTRRPPAARLSVFLVLRPRSLSSAPPILSTTTPASSPPFLLLPPALLFIILLKSFGIDCRRSRVRIAQGDGSEQLRRSRRWPGCAR